MNYFCFLLVFSLGSGLVICCSNCPPNSSCIEDNCVCDKGHVLSEDKSQCLPYVTEYFGECSENVQCDWLGENSECNFVCRCTEKYRWYLGKCEPYAGLGEECSNKIKCYDGYNMLALSCKDAKCQCSHGYYQRGETDCRKLARENEICALDMDCQKELICHIGKCIKADSKLEEEIDELEEMEVEQYVALEPTPCNEDKDCETITNSMCYINTGTCVCNHGYFLNDQGLCAPELGQDVNCQKHSDCQIRPGQCLQGVCYCRDYYFVAEGNKKCVKTMSQNNWNCLSKEWCYAFGPYGFCNSNETCQCSGISKYEEENMLCLWDGDADPDRCIDDFECEDKLENGYCIDEKCGCAKYYLLTSDGKRCVPGLGAPCDIASDCSAVKNSDCIENVCQCEEKYVYWESECYLKSDGLNDTCELDIQCNSVTYFSECKNATCLCQDDRIEYKTTCIPRRSYNDYCNNRIECLVSLEDTFGDEILCRNHKCQCPTGLTLRDNDCSSGGIIMGNLIVTVVLLLKNLYALC